MVKQEPCALSVGKQTDAATEEDSTELPHKIKNRTTLCNYTSGYLTKEYKNTKSKGYVHPNVYSSIINNNQTLETAQVSINWWMDKEDMVCVIMQACVCAHAHTHTHTGILLSH